MNETLRRALVQARLTEEDVATHLQVDPKTVRRWVEGRTPYLRHRWALAALLRLDEADLWPQLRTVRSRPDEIRAIYPHSGSIPKKVWQELFQSAQQEIGILADGESFPPDEQGILSVLHERAEAGVKLLICLRAPDSPKAKQTLISRWDTLSRSSQPGQAEIRLHRIHLHNSIYRSDNQLIISQRAFAISDSTPPAFRLCGDNSTGLVATYIESFYGAWGSAEPIA